MSRLIFVPQFPTKMRYQELWYHDFPDQFQKYFDEVIVIGKKSYIENREFLKIGREASMFSPIKDAINFELFQMKEYEELELKNDDILFWADLSFPGFFANILYHKKPRKCFAFCHATSLNYLDYFEKVRFSKFPLETAQSKLFEKIFVGSHYHKNKLKWENIEVTALPIPSIFKKIHSSEKIYDIISVCRPNPQKVDLNLEKGVERVFSKIHRKTFDNWEDYMSFLYLSKVLLITTKEDTFNYTILDAVQNGCIPIAPNKLCFPEILPREYLYDDLDELLDTITIALGGHLEVPELLCQDKVDNFYKNICEIMKG